jgi:DNA-binding NarL/FixJ family response regulator
VLLLGATETLGETIGYPRTGWARDAYDRIAASTSSILGDETFATLWRRGRQLTVAEATMEALPVPDGSVSSASSTDATGLTFVPSRLTPREREVLRLLAEGHSDRQIAAALSISPKTVGNHVSRILAKLDVETRTAAATQALRGGLV